MSDESRSQEKDDNVRGDLDALLQKIYDDRGYDFREYKRASIQHWINKRLSDNHLSTYEQYMALLGRKPDEYAKLFDTLLINATEFFRDPEAWDVIEIDVMPKLLQNKTKDSPIRFWSVGCSTGEEPYSLAILLADKLGSEVADYDIRIYATDIDEKALNEARHGVYSSAMFKNVKEEYLKKYFIKDNGFYKVQRFIRQMVAFGRHDLVTDEPISSIDLIICRNVLIYFKVDLQGRILLKFHDALNNNGFIFCGKSESMPAGSSLFIPINKKWRIFQKVSTRSPMASTGELPSIYPEESLVTMTMSDVKMDGRAMEFNGQSIGPGIVIVDPYNTILMWNEAAGELWGFKPDHAVGRNFFDIGMGEKIPGAMKTIMETGSDHQTLTFQNIETANKYGVSMLVDISLIPLISPTKEKLGILIMMTSPRPKGSTELL